jgi:hypothetical protein
MDKSKFLHFLKSGVVILVILVGMVWANTYYRGRAEYIEGEKYFKEAMFKDAIAAYGTSVRMYTPFSSYVPASLQRLWEIGEGYRQTGQYDRALIAYRDLRSGVYAIRSIYSPYEEWIPRTDERIAQTLELQKGADEGPRPAGAVTPHNE